MRSAPSLNLTVRIVDHWSRLGNTYATPFPCTMSSTSADTGIVRINAGLVKSTTEMNPSCPTTAERPSRLIEMHVGTLASVTFPVSWPVSGSNSTSEVGNPDTITNRFMVRLYSASFTWNRSGMTCAHMAAGNAISPNIRHSWRMLEIIPYRLAKINLVKPWCSDILTAKNSYLHPQQTRLTTHLCL